jgi:hypothetical protein
MLKTIASALISGALASAATFTGTITDDMCGKEGHAGMKMGTDEKCITSCVKGMNAKYALTDGTNVYVLSDQKTPAKFAAQKVTVTGTLDEKTRIIKVEKIETAK